MFTFHVPNTTSLKAYFYRAFFVLTGCLIFGVSNSALFAQKTYTGDSWSSVQENKTGEITAVYLAEDAFAYTNEEGELTGIEIDIFQQFLNYLKNTQDINLDVTYVKKSKSFGNFYNTVKNSSGGVFGLGTVTILDKRKEEVQFTPPWINNVAVLVSYESVPTLQSMEELPEVFAGKTAIVIENTTLETRIKELKKNYFPRLKTTSVNSQNAALDMVIEGEGKYFTYLDVAIFWPAYQNGEPVKRHKVGDQASEVFGFIMPKDSDWRPAFEEFFDLGGDYRSNPAYRKILIKHLGPEYTKMLEMARKKNSQ